MSQARITSMHNQRIKDAVRLRDRRGRDQQGRIVIDGARELLRAISAGVVVREVFVCEEACHTPEAQRVLEWSGGSAVSRYDVTPPVFEKLSFGQRAEGVVAVADAPQRGWHDLGQLGSPPLVAVLESVEKPGNLGAICRTADAAGVSAILLADPRTDVFGPNAIRASLGTVFTVPIVQAPVNEILAWLKAEGLRMIATQVDAAGAYTAADYRGPTAIILGSEAHGLSDAWSAAEITPVHVPMLGAADSLNVSVVAGLLFYEALRQRTVAAAE
jgi:TrmH family RNA methyltransferase